MITHESQFPTKPEWHTGFLKMLPIIVRTAHQQLRNLTPEVREDAIAEVIANSTIAYARLVERGKESVAYPTVLAMYAVRQYRDGRRVGSGINSKDVYDKRARERGGYEIVHLGAPDVRRLLQTDDYRGRPA